MNNYLDLTKYSDTEILSMYKQKQKEYMLLIQSEKAAKMILDYYGEEFYTSEYHSRVNKEYYLIYEKANKKGLLDNPNTIEELGVPTRTVIARLEDSRDELRRENNPEYLPYSRRMVDIIDNITYNFHDKTILYKYGYLYLVDENKEETLLTDEVINELFDGGKKKTL